jgi:hypothetical protein
MTLLTSACVYFQYAKSGYADMLLWCDNHSYFLYNPLKTSGNYIYHQFSCYKIQHSAHKMYVCVPCDSHNEGTLYLCTELTDWFLWWTCVVTKRYELDILIQAKLNWSRAMTQAVSRQPLTAETRARSQGSQREICGGQSGTETVFSQSTSVFPCLYHFTNAQYSYLATRFSCRKDKWAKPGNLPKTMLFQKSVTVGYRGKFAFCNLKWVKLSPQLWDLKARRTLAIFCRAII